MKENDRQILSRQPDGGAEVVENEESRYTPSDVTVGGVVRCLVHARDEAEAEVVRLQVSIGTLEKRLEDSIGRLLELEKVNEENHRLREDNERLAGDNRAMNEKLQHAVRGAISLAELRAIRK